MIDLHSHSIFSDGELIPSELARRAEDKGYVALGITDHGDASNIDFIIPRLIKACESLEPRISMTVLAGVELTHVFPADIPAMARQARKLGAQIVVVHGETIMEPVRKGTNRMALESDIDILAHPGFITLEEAKLAKKRGICLEITGRKGHSYTNGWVAKMAKKAGASLVFDTDSHAPTDLTGWERAREIIMGAGLSAKEALQLQLNSGKIVKKALARKKL